MWPPWSYRVWRWLRRRRQHVIVEASLRAVGLEMAATPEPGVLSIFVDKPTDGQVGLVEVIEPDGLCHWEMQCEHGISECFEVEGHSGRHVNERYCELAREQDRG